jgi:hypothetical protein
VARSGAFADSWEEEVFGTELQQLWCDRLPALAMAQRPAWRARRYVLVHSARNPAFGEAAERYRRVHADPSTFQVLTVEELLDSGLLQTGETERAFLQRFLW